MKLTSKEKAIKLRRRGYSYSEILKEIPVAKSTLSIWLKSVGLSREQKQRLTDKKLAGMKKGWEARRRNRIEITGKIKEEARAQIGRLSKRELWLFGIALYGAEGNKEKERGSLVIFGNSDRFLIKIFLKWLQDICYLPKNDIHFLIFLHETAKDRLPEIKKYWSEVTGFTIDHFQKVTWKRNRITSYRKNRGDNYFGLLRIIVKRSTNLNRKIQGWAEGVYNNCGVV